MALALVSVVMLFMGFSLAYVARLNFGRFDPITGLYFRDWQALPLPIHLLLFNTLLLLLSSATLELSRRDHARRMALAPVLAMPGISSGRERGIPWLAFTIVLGSGFLTGQGWAWHLLTRRGVDMAWGPSGSYFYLLTGAHAVHLIGGLLALLYAGALALRSRSIEKRRLVVDITALYWHVMAVLWVGLFALLVFAK